MVQILQSPPCLSSLSGEGPPAQSSWLITRREDLAKIYGALHSEVNDHENNTYSSRNSTGKTHLLV